MERSNFNRGLFERYLEICNQAIDANKDRFPFKQILSAASAADENKNVEVCIIDDHPEDAFVIQMGEEGIIGQPHGDCADCECDSRWKVTRSYLEHVIDNPRQ